jgi:hypothetical protein
MITTNSEIPTLILKNFFLIYSFQNIKIISIDLVCKLELVNFRNTIIDRENILVTI